MRRLFLAVLAALLLPGCARLGKLLGCDCAVTQGQPEKQDLTLEMPLFNASDSKVVMEGVVLQAIRVAADDFLGRDRADEACWDKQAAHTYQTIQRDDVIFVRIDYNPASCGEKFHSLDSGATYAIDKNGHLLRRVLDGEPLRLP
jgi:hypothetical protein